MKIAVFDSGIGGKAIADRLKSDYPNVEILYVNDYKNVPYGTRSQDEIVSLTDSAIQPLLRENCDVIVLACNTATAAAIEILRGKYASTPFIGLEPMVKPAVAVTKAGIIAICATPSTLSSDRYKALKQEYATSTTILEPDCSDWAYMIENNTIASRKVERVIEDICSAGADVIVLACTHYHWIKDEIVAIANGRAIVIDPSDAVSERVKAVLGL